MLGATNYDMYTKIVVFPVTGRWQKLIILPCLWENVFTLWPAIGVGSPHLLNLGHPGRSYSKNCRLFAF